MQAKIIPDAALRGLRDPAGQAALPALPTWIVTSFKGGTAKTSIAVAVAERLAHAGLRVLLTSTDPQADCFSRLRLSCPTRDHPVRRVVMEASTGFIDCHTRTTEELLHLVYAETLRGQYDVLLVDTPAEERLGRLPGVRYVVPVDGYDGLRNAGVLLRGIPPTSTATLIRFGASDTWERDMEKFYAYRTEAGLSRENVYFYGEPIRRTKAVADAHQRGDSVWSLRRRPALEPLLAVTSGIAWEVWSEVHPDEDFPPPPPAAQGQLVPVVEGWDG